MVKDVEIREKLRVKKLIEKNKQNGLKAQNKNPF